MGKAFLHRCFAAVATAAAAVLFAACADTPQVVIVPQPSEIQAGTSSFRLVSGSVIAVDAGDAEALQIAGMLRDLLQRAGVPATVSEGGPDLPADVRLTRAAPDTLGAEGYLLTVDSRGATIAAPAGAGLFYGVQTLRQLMPAGVEAGARFASGIDLPHVAVADKPAFGWRGLNLDCCRHFMEIGFVKRYVDLLAYHKMNVLHWHLTDDQGWRIEIPGYPQLTEVGAWRQTADGTRHGGFYTLDQVREVVEYARQRYVRVVPEIEMPGHAVAAVASYPHLSCAGKQIPVETGWGVFKDILCAGNEQTFKFIEDVMTTVTDLFPSPYIHIGGDEAPKYRWEHCAKCTQRLRDEGLADYEQLQTYFISRVARFLETKGRKVIGWDEILEGGRPHGAAVQAWQGIDRARKAVRAGAPVVVSPTSHCYLDYPLTSIDLARAYTYDPVPDSITPEQRALILGGEGNMWTERAPQSTIDSKVFPRILAINEILWNYPAERDYEAFRARLAAHYERLAAMGVNYGFEQSAVSFTSTLSAAGDTVTVAIERGQQGLDIRFTTDGTEPTPSSPAYSGPIAMASSGVVKAAAYSGANRVDVVAERRFAVSKSTGRPLQLGYAPAPQYLGGSQQALVDGRQGTEFYNDGVWQAVQGTPDMSAVVDLGPGAQVSRLAVGFMQSNPSWIFMPSRVDFLVSDDGASFRLVASVASPVSPRDGGVVLHTFEARIEPTACRYAKMVAHNAGPCPDWHPAAGEPTWLFADEFAVE